MTTARHVRRLTAALTATALALVLAPALPVAGDAGAALAIVPGTAEPGATVTLTEDTEVFPDLNCGQTTVPGELSATWALVRYDGTAEIPPAYVFSDPDSVEGTVVDSGTVEVVRGEAWSVPVTIPADATDGDVYFARGSCLLDGELLGIYFYSAPTLIVAAEPPPPSTDGDPTTEAEPAPTATPAEPVAAPATLTG